MPLHHAPPGDPRVLDNAPVAVLLAILPANFAAQSTRWPPIIGTLAALRGRLGRHYSRFSAPWPAAPLAASITCPAKIAKQRVEYTVVIAVLVISVRLKVGLVVW